MGLSEDKTKKNALMYHIMFICTGNSCRSPMAEGLLKKLIPANYQNKIHVSSAGVGGFDDYPPTIETIEVSAENGVDIRKHRSRSISISMVEKANLILVMAKDHERIMRLHFSNYADHIFLLKTFEREKKFFMKESISDPIGRDINYYRMIFKEIETEIKRILPIILKLTDEYLSKHQSKSQEDEEGSVKNSS